MPEISKMTILPLKEEVALPNCTKKLDIVNRLNALNLKSAHKEGAQVFRSEERRVGKECRL